MRVVVTPNERVLVRIDGRYARYLRPGSHSIWAPFRKVELLRYPLTGPVAEVEAEELRLIPPEDLSLVELLPHERAVVYRRGRPVAWLSVGAHTVWTAERLGRDAHPAVRIERLDTSGVATAPLRDEVRPLVPGCDYVEAMAAEGSVVLRYVDGALEAVLPAGRHAAWTTVRKVTLSAIDVRERVLNVAGQEVMTRDRVSLRLNLSATFSVEDARRLATVARAPDEVVHLAIQLAAREAVSSRTLDELLAAREELSKGLANDIRGRLTEVGLRLVEFGIKDLILPGEMKVLLNRVIEAQKEAEANVIFRREEAAATRSMAQTAKTLSENPLLIRLKELESYEKLAGKVGNIHLVMGEAALPKLELKVT